MLKKLKKIEMNVYWIDDKGDKHEGIPSWLRGDVSGLSGDVTGLRGNVTGISGDVDDCSITYDERKSGINIIDLIDNT